MGGVKSKFSQVEWEAADGGLESAEQTLDGAAPTSEYTMLTLVKTSKVKDRGFNVFLMPPGTTADAAQQSGSPQYKVKKIDWSWNSFEVFDASGKLCVRVIPGKILSSFSWKIVSTKGPKFNGQEPDPEALKKKDDTSTALYKWFKVEYSTSLFKAKMRAYEPVRADDDPNPLGEVHKDSGPLLELDEIRSAKARFQTSRPDHPDSLLSYWEWQNSMKEHKMVLHVAKHSDTLLHVVLAVLANLTMIERQASYNSGNY
ncbi:hypothetical protein FVE85_9351 [Porphyridium purpureum]|uniref:Uncharacterized protein n=1 Tax=Porphyridium purpureum TaxID=35688 RepID=A0A5J4YNS6_PORPP|nr:hypothetical protein FVE85_9351 [Porphyridium purpureum]|eukprot:POR6012..scf222_8